MANIKSSNQFLESVKKEEDFRAEPYVDAAGVLTQGYGDTINKPEGKIDEATAEARLKQNVSTFEQELSDRIIRDDLNANQQDALLDAAYNTGTANLEKWGLFEAINTGDDERVQKILGSITKARDPKTGKLRTLKGLVERSKRRSALWSTPVEDDSFFSDLIQENGGEDSDEFFSGLVNEVSQEDKIPSMIDPRTQHTIEDNRVIAEADEIDPERQRQLLAFSSKFKIPLDEADALLEEGEFDDVMAAPELKLAENNYPGIARWARPENYHLLRDNVDFFKTTEKAVATTYTNSLKKAFKRSGLETQRLAQFAKISLMGDSPKEREAMILELERLDKEKLKHIEHKYEVGKKRIVEGASGIARFTRPLDNLVEAGLSLYSGDKDTARKELIKAIIDFKKLKEDPNYNVHVKLWEMAEAIKENPGATGVMAAESSVSSAIPLGTSLAGYMTPIPGGAVAGGFVGGSILGFYQFVSEEAQEFSRNDGTIDYRKFFSDPIRLGKMRKKALAYGITHGLVDGLLARVGGKGIVGKLSEPIEAAKAFGKRTAINIGEEVSGEFAASMMAGKGFEKSSKEALLEGPAAFVSGTGFTIFGIARDIWEQKDHEQKFDTYIKTVDKSIRAKSNRKSLQSLRELFSSSEVPKSNPEQLKEFINETFVAENEQESSTTGEPETEIPDGATPEEVKSIENEQNEKGGQAEQQAINTAPSSEPTVQFDIKEWNEYHEKIGVNPAEAAAQLGEAAGNAYLDAVNNGVSFEVPFADYLIKSEATPELDDIVRMSDDDISSNEADKIFNDLDQNFKDYLDIGDDSDQDAEPVVFQEDDREPEQGEPVLRPVELYRKYRNKQHKNTHDKIRKDFRKALITSKLSRDLDIEEFDEFVNFVTEIEFRRLRQRSSVLGRDIEDLAADRKIMFDETLGSYVLGRYRIGLDGKGKLQYGTFSDAKTVVHELGHNWLQEMALDWKFIHELDSAKLTPAQAAYKKSMQIALELINENVLNKNTPITTLEGIANLSMNSESLEAIHETFAQTTEEYFMNGKFANNRVRYLMEQMRAWVKKVFEKFSYDHYPPFQMSPETERMFEGMLGISTQIDEEVNAMFSNPMFSEEMMGKDWEKYRDAILEVRSNLIGEIYSKATLKSYDQREKEIDNAINKLVDEAAAEIDKLPSVQMVNDIQAMEPEVRISREDLRRQILISVGIPSGSMPKNFKLSDIYKEFPNITRPDGIVTSTRIYLEDQMKGLPKNIRTGTRTAPLVHHFMSMFNIVDRKKFLELLQEAGAYDDLVAKRTSELIKEKMPAFKTDEEIHLAAVESVADKGPDKLMKMELQKLIQDEFPKFKKLNKAISLPPTHQRRAIIGLLKTEARKLVYAAKENVKPMDYFKVSQKAGKIATEMFLDGDIVSAIDYKQKQILYYEAFAEATKVQKQVGRARDLIKRVMRSKNDKKNARYYDIDIYKFARKAAFLADNGLEIPEFELGAVDTPHSTIDYSGIQMVNDAIAMINEENVGKRKEGHPFSNTSRLALGTVVQQLLAMARDQKIVDIAGQIFERDAMVTSLVNSIGPRKKGDPQTDRYKGLKYKANITTFRTIIAGLYPSEEAFAKSPLMRLFDEAANAEADLILHKNEGVTKLANSLKEIAKKDEGLLKVINPLARRLGGLGVEVGAGLASFIAQEQEVRDKGKTKLHQFLNEQIHSSELGVTFDSIGEVMMVILHSGSESGRAKFLRGGVKGSGELAGIDPMTGLVDDSKLNAFIDRLVAEGVLTDAHFDLAETVWDFFKKHYEPSKQAIRHIYGYDIGHINSKPTTVTFPDGSTRTITGGYIPASQSSEYAGLVDGDFSIEEQNNFVHDLFPQSDIAFSNQRTQTPYELSLSLEFLPSQYHRVLQAAYMKKPMYELGKLFEDERFVRAIEERRPGVTEGVIVPWFKRSMAQQYSRPAEGGEIPFNEAARVIRKNMYTSAFLGNFASFIQQFSGIPQAAAIIPAKYLARGSARLATSSTSEILSGQIALSNMLNEIADKSKRMNVRFKMSQKQFSLSHDKLDLNGDWLSWSNEKVEAATFMLIQYAQSRTDIAVWSGAEEYAITELGLSEKEAIAYADNVVERTQGSANLTSRAGILDGPEYKRLFTAFTTFNITQYGIIEEQSMRYADKPALEKFRKLMRVLLFITMVPAAVTVAIFAARSPKESEKEKRRKKRKGDDGYLAEAGLFMAEEYINANVPIFGRAAIATFKKDSGGLLPAARNLVSAGRGLDGFSQTAQGVTLTPSIIRNMDKTVTMITGLPILSPIAWWYRIKEISEDPKKRRHRNRVRRKQLKKLERQKRRKSRR